MDLEVGMRLKSKSTGKLCTIEEINEKWDWFSVVWDRKTRGCKDRHEIGKVSLYFTVVRSTTKQIERADEFLKRANGGLDDSWREYD